MSEDKDFFWFMFLVLALAAIGALSTCSGSSVTVNCPPSEGAEL